MSVRVKRPDIQYLRALAVSLVLLYHAGIPGLSNGFLGVDIFFVISGFLMASIYGNASFKSFYLARVKRLIPGLTLVTFTTIFISAIFLTPYQFKELVREGVLGITGLSNFYFWSEDTYFAPDRFRPLLHLWTLALEFQFYLIFPFINKYSKKFRSLWPILTLGSFALSQLLLYKSPKTSFFLLPPRIWEFALGVLAASLTLKVSESATTTKYLIRLTSLILVLTGLLMQIDPNSTFGLSGHPGIAAVLVSLGTCLLLAIKFPTLKVSSKPNSFILKIGDASYLIYLVHYPLFVFMNYSPFRPSDTSLSGLKLQIIGIFVAIYAGVLISEYFEKPLLKREFKPRKVAWSVIAASTLSLILVPINFESSTPILKNISSSIEDRSPYRCGKLFRITNPTSKVCPLHISDVPNAPNLMLLGNSHADMVKSEFIQRAKKYDYNLFFWADNNPFTGSDEAVDSIYAEIKRLNISILVLHSSYLYPSAEEIQSLIDKTDSKNVRIFMLESIPTFNDSVPVLEFTQGDIADTRDNINVNPESLEVSKQYLVINSKRFKYVSTHEYFCTPVCAWRDSAGHLFYFDSNHLTLIGAQKISEPIEQIVIEALAKKG